MSYSKKRYLKVGWPRKIESHETASCQDKKTQARAVIDQSLKLINGLLLLILFLF
jgi:hypothetical protein